MQLKANYYKHRLRFKFEAGTSRGVLTERDTYFINLQDVNNQLVMGIGEASPLSGLSIDERPDFEEKLQYFIRQINQITISQNADIQWVTDLIPAEFPSIRFALETAWLDLQNGGQGTIFKNDFSQGYKPLIINGLIWMGKPDFMLAQIEEKLQKGFSCLKMKIGAIDFEAELNILKTIRQNFPAHQITLRVDANGAFNPPEAMSKLEKLAKLEIHSIEQPIKAGQLKAMSQLCQDSPLAIALDEELIGIQALNEKIDLLEFIRPPYIILKPTLVGGFKSCEEWIKLADYLGIRWWMTSALEANIGLNAISQFTAQYDNPIPQGLGTGSLYHNNLNSPLELTGENLWYNPNLIWEKPNFL
jgi:o-succinylbenzoate synthase